MTEGNLIMGLTEEYNKTSFKYNFNSDFRINCGIIKLTHIVLDNDPKFLTFDNVIQIIIGGAIIYSPSIKFFLLKNGYREDNGKFIIPIDIFEIDLYLLVFHYFNIEIKLNENYKEVGLLYNNIFNQTIIDDIIDGLIDGLTDDIKDVKFKILHIVSSIIENCKKLNILIKSEALIDNLLLNCNFSNIKSISVDYFDEKIPMMKLSEYNAQTIKNELKIIDNLLEIPIDYREIKKIQYANNPFRKLTNIISPNNEGDGTIKLEIEFYENESKINLYGNAWNYFRYLWGMGAKVYNISSDYHDSNYFMHEIIYQNETDKIVHITDYLKEVNYDNFAENIMSLKIYNPTRNLLNLPLGIKKVEVYGDKYVKIKVPFGCEYVELI